MLITIVFISGCTINKTSNKQNTSKNKYTEKEAREMRTCSEDEDCVALACCDFGVAGNKNNVHWFSENRTPSECTAITRGYTAYCNNSYCELKKSKF